MGIKITESDGFQVLPMGQYQLALKEIEWYPTTKQGWADQLAWKFVTIEEHSDVDGEPVEPGLSIWGWSTDTYSPKSRAWSWAAGLLNGSASPASLIVDGELEPGEIIGRVATVKVNTYEKDGDLKNSVIKEDDAVTRPSKKYAGQVMDVGGTEQSDYETAEELAEDIPF